MISTSSCTPSVLWVHLLRLENYKWWNPIIVITVQFPKILSQRGFCMHFQTKGEKKRVPFIELLCRTSDPVFLCLMLTAILEGILFPFCSLFLLQLGLLSRMSCWHTPSFGFLSVSVWDSPERREGWSINLTSHLPVRKIMAVGVLHVVSWS